MKIYYTPKFEREYRKLPQKIKKIAKTKELIFKTNPFDARLKTHALTGKLKGAWSFSIDFKTRIIFDFVNDSEVWFHTVGSHDIYKH